MAESCLSVSNARDSSDCDSTLLSDLTEDKENNDNASKERSSSLRNKADVYRDIPDTSKMDADDPASPVQCENTESDVSDSPRSVNSENEVGDVPKTVSTVNNVSDFRKTDNTAADVSGILKPVNADSDISDIHKTAVNTVADISGILISVNTNDDVSSIHKAAYIENNVSGILKAINMDSGVSGIPRTVYTENNASDVSKYVGTDSDLSDIPQPEITDSNDVVIPTHRTAVQDQGWAWVVCFACFIVLVIFDGIYFSIGIVFVEFLDYFGRSRRETAVIVSLCYGLGCLLGPLYAYLSNRFGCRSVVISGAIISSSAFIISIFAPNVYFLYLTFGVMAGFGYGCAYLPSILVINYYFNKRRAFALGLCMCGSGLGVLIFGPLTKHLIQLYSWKGAVLINAGVILNVVACGLVYLPIDVKHEDGKRTGDAAGRKTMQGKIKRQDRNSLTEEYFPLTMDVEERVVTSCSSENISKVGFVKGTSDTDEYTDRSTRIPDNAYERFITRDVMNVTARLHDNDMDISGVMDTDPKDQISEYCVAEETDYVKDYMDGEHNERCRPASLTRRENIKNYILSVLKNNFGVILLGNRPYMLLVITSFLCNSVYVTPFVFLPDKAKDDGIDEFKSSWLVSTIGISSLAGRFLCGVISDIPGVNRVLVDIVCIFISGMCMALIPLCSPVELLFACCVVLGFSFGASVMLSPVLVGDFVGKENMAKAFGILNFAWGASLFVGPPIIGWLHDVSGSYDISFITSGIVYAIGALVLSPIPLCRFSYGNPIPEVKGD